MTETSETNGRETMTSVCSFNLDQLCGNSIKLNLRLPPWMARFALLSYDMANEIVMQISTPIAERIRKKKPKTNIW